MSIILLACRKHSNDNWSYFPALLKNGKYGYINQFGNVVIEGKFKYASDFANEFVIVEKTTGRFGIINKSGDLVIRDDFDYIYHFKKQLFLGKISKMNYIIDPINRRKVRFEYDIVDYWKNNTIIIKNKDQYGLALKYGQIIIKPKYDMLLCSFDLPQNPHYNFQYAIVRKGQKEGYIDSLGNEIISPQFDYALPFYSGFAKVMKNNKWMLINEGGEVITKKDYDRLCDWFTVTDTFDFNIKRPGFGLFYMFDENASMDERTYFKNGLTPFMKKNKWGFLDTQGHEKIVPRYSNAKFFSEGYAAVSIGKVWGYIDESGDFAIKPNYDNACSFSNGSAIVESNGESFIIDKRGNKLSDYYHSMVYVSYGLPKFLSYIIVGQKETGDTEKFGVIDCQGKIIIPIKFWRISINNYKYFQVDSAGSQGLFDLQGNMLTTINYKIIYQFAEGYAGFEKIRSGQPIYGFIDRRGKEIIVDNIIWIPTLKNGLALVSNGNRRFYINAKGKTIYTFPK